MHAPIYLTLKRVMDVLGALVALVLLGPILAVASIAILVQMGRPLFFTQLRSGRHKTRFRVYKLRSMIADPTGTLSDEQRITQLGHFIRRYSIDELPQLWNVLRGDMSLVGPRPLLPEYDDKYSDHQNRRFLTRPGLSGWAQVNGRNDLTWEEKLDLDVAYVDKQSLWLDIRILFMTVGVVVQSAGFRPAGEDAKFGEHR